MKAFVECTKGSKLRTEVVKGGYMTSFEIDKPWVANYGFIEDTLQADGDALDCYILGKPLEMLKDVDVAVVASIICFDNGVRDDKFICIPVGSKMSDRAITRTINKLVKTLRKTKPGMIVIGVRTSYSWLYYELVKYRSLYRLFNKGE